MNISIGRMMNFAALAVFAGTGLMQGAQQATFHLPVAAHWGQALLEPGDYKMVLPAPSAGQVELLVKGVDTNVYELPFMTDFHNTSNSSYLKLLAINGNYFVRELSFGPSGKTFTFSVPKTSHRLRVEKSENRMVHITGD